MVILIVDNDASSLHRLEKYVRECRRDDEIVVFTDAVLAMDYIEEHEIDIMFTEVSMCDVTGFTLTKRIKEKAPNAYVVFVTESAEYAMNAWEAHVNGYLQKPVDSKKIKTELEYAIR